MSARIFCLLPVLIALAGCGGKQPPAMGPPQVTVATPLVRQITDWDEYTGQLAAVESVEIRARVSGYLQSIHFEDGALVKRGDLLFVIDPRPYEAALDEARADLTQAKVRLELASNDLDRAKRLFASRAISEEELDARTKEHRQAEASLEAAQAAEKGSALNLEFARIKAPVSGRIGRKLVTVGNLVSSSGDKPTLLTTIVSVDPIHVYFTADERAFLRYTRLAEQLHARKQSGRQAPIRIGKDGASLHGAGRPVHLVVDEIHVSLVGKILFVRELQPDRIGGVARAGADALFGEARVTEKGALVGREIHVDRIDRHDGGQQGRLVAAAADQVADRDQFATDASADRRLDAGELEIQRRAFFRSLRGFQRGLRLAMLLGACIQFFFGDGA